MLTSTFQDLRYALRALLKHRNFTAAALLTLALGIGINTSIFTLLYSVAFRPLPVKNPDRVVNVYQTLEGEFSRQVEGSVELLSYPEYLNYRDRVAGVSGLAASADVKLYLGGNNVERINGLMVTDNYFSLLGGGSALGRTFFDKECQTPLQCPVAVLSYGFWQRRFGSDQERNRHFAHAESPALHCTWSGGTRFSWCRDDRSRCLDSGNDAARGDAREQVSGAPQL